MKFSLSKITFGIVSTLGISLTSTITAAVEVEETSVKNGGAVERIAVLGSRRIGRTISESNVPVDVLSADILQEGGFTDMNRQLQNAVPSFNYFQPSLVDGTDHIKPASLRGLAPDQTLVLLNGRRFHSSALLNLNGSAGRGSVSVDLNAIPSAAIERIEILRDGAAAQYGSDAIAGVINIITKKDAEGGIFTLSAGQNITTLDGVPELTGVQTDADGNVVANGSRRVAGIYGKDISRKDGETVNLAANAGFGFLETGYLNLTAEYNNANATNRGGLDDGDTYAKNPDGSFDKREITTNRDRFFFGAPESESYSVLASSGYEFDSGSEFYSTFTLQNRKSVSGAFFREAADEAFLIQKIYPDGFTPRIHADIDDWSLLAGFKGGVGEWDYNASVVTGKNSVGYNNTNTANVTYLLDTPTSFYGGKLSSGQDVINVDFSRFYDVDFLDSPIAFAVGAEYRRDSYEIRSGDVEAYTNRPSLDENGKPIFDDKGNPVYPTNRLFAQGSLFFSKNSEVDKSRNSKAIYAEVDADLTDKWNLVLAARYENYSDFGSATNGKIATRYNLTEDFAIRGSFSTGFRAPSLQQQFYTSTNTNFIEGVAFEIGTVAATSKAARALGGKQLDAEKATNYSLGFTWDIQENLNLTLDAYHIDIDDRVVLSETLGDDDAEREIVKKVFAENNIEGINAIRFFINGVNSKTEGVDINLAYQTEALSGDLKLSTGFNYNKTEVSEVLNTAGPSSLFTSDQLFARRERARLENAAPKQKANVTANWSKDALSLMLRTNYYGELTQPGRVSDADVTVDKAFIFDAEASYNITENLVASLGVNNLFDKYPTSAIERDQKAGKAPSQFDYVIPYANFSPYGFQGRYVYLRASLSF
ncbi:TonB-dependent receptor [Parashewanella curva]|uniref:TonB-dependent receptor n=1 Tax=Parashewanella curva TaxID=2338552 RepID=A0A3L8PW54_9GAMM|nr:TonB-dependent receptor [Parashewanella curva]RLV59576.1 TonB-dependent receptor [Parashewanella curva]